MSVVLRCRKLVGERMRETGPRVVQRPSGRMRHFRQTRVGAQSTWPQAVLRQMTLQIRGQRATCHPLSCNAQNITP